MSFCSASVRFVFVMVMCARFMVLFPLNEWVSSRASRPGMVATIACVSLPESGSKSRAITSAWGELRMISSMMSSSSCSFVFASINVCRGIMLQTSFCSSWFCSRESTAPQSLSDESVRVR